MKILRLLPVLAISFLITSTTSCVVQKDNGKHKGWFKFKSKGNSHQAKTVHPGKGNGNGNGSRKVKKK